MIFLIILHALAYYVIHRIFVFLFVAFIVRKKKFFCFSKFLVFISIVTIIFSLSGFWPIKTHPWVPVSQPQKTTISYSRQLLQWTVSWTFLKNLNQNQRKNSTKKKLNLSVGLLWYTRYGTFIGQYGTFMAYLRQII